MCIRDRCRRPVGDGDVESTTTRTEFGDQTICSSDSAGGAIDLSSIVSEIQRDTGRRSRIFHTVVVFGAVSVGDGLRRNFVTSFPRRKLQRLGCRWVRKV